MVTFANPIKNRFCTANSCGTEESTMLFDLQRFKIDGASGVFGMMPDASDDTIDATSGEESDQPSEQAETEIVNEEAKEQTPQTKAGQTPTKTTKTQGQSAQKVTGESAPEADPLAKYRGKDGQIDMKKLEKDFSYFMSETGRTRNELNAARKERDELQRRIQQWEAQAKPAVSQNRPPEQIDRAKLNEQFVEAFAQDPLGALSAAIQAIGGPMLAPMAEYLTQDVYRQDSTNWWVQHPDARELWDQMQQEYENWKDILDAPHPQNPNIPLFMPSRRLELLYRVVKGVAAPQAIQQAAEAAAQAAVEGEKEKVGATLGSAGKAPVGGRGKTGLELMSETLKELSNPFGIGLEGG